VRPAKGAVGNGGGESVLALFDRGVRQSDNRDLIGVPPSGVDFDLHFKRFDPDNGGRINLRRHNRARNCFIVATFARNVFA
jgi:hypothetical protein